jgi:transposase
MHEASLPQPLPHPPSPLTRASRREPLLSPSEQLELSRLASTDHEDEALRMRARIVLSWAAGVTGAQSAQALGTSRRTVSKWRSRFREGGVDALKDRPRPGARQTLDPALVAEVLRLRDSPPPHGKARWTTRMIAAHTGLSQSTVVRIVRRFSVPSPIPLRSGDRTNELEPALDPRGLLVQSVVGVERPELLIAIDRIKAKGDVKLA